MKSIQYWLSIYLLSRKSDIDANDWVEVGDVDCQSVSMSVVKKGAILLLRPHWEEEGYAGISVTY